MQYSYDTDAEFYTSFHPIVRYYTCNNCSKAFKKEAGLAHFPASNTFVKHSDFALCNLCSQTVDKEKIK